MTTSINEIFRKYNCKKIISESYCEENLKDHPCCMYTGLKALVYSEKYFENPASIETINDKLLLSRIIFDYKDDTLIYKFIVPRHADCISNFKLRLIDSQNNELIFNDYIEKIWLGVGNNDFIESDMINSEKLFPDINYNNPINILGLTYCEIVLNIKFNNFLLEIPFWEIIIYIDYIFLTNKLRISLVKNNTSFTNNCTNYTISGGTIKKQNNLIPDNFHLFSTRIIEPKIKTNAIILHYNIEPIIIKFHDIIKYISIYPTERCMTNFDKYIKYDIKLQIIYLAKTTFSYKFHSKSSYEEFTKCHSNILFLIS